MASTTVSAIDLDANRLLAVLTDADRARLTPHMSLHLCESDTVLQSANELVVHTWFPCGAALAAFCVSAGDGREIDVALVGHEGAIGGIVSHGALPAYATAKVRNAGHFLRIQTIALEHQKLESIYLRHWFSRYSDCLLAQVFQTTACNATHTVAQRVGKWLLAAIERTGEEDVAISQENLAHMLGVGRSFVTRVLGQFRSQEILQTRRGRIVVRDQPALRAVACTCTTRIEQHFTKVLGGTYG